MALFKRKPASSSYGKRGDSPHGGDSKSLHMGHVQWAKDVYNMTPRQARRNSADVKTGYDNHQRLYSGLNQDQATGIGFGNSIDDIAHNSAQPAVAEASNRLQNIKNKNDKKDWKKGKNLPPQPRMFGNIGKNMLGGSPFD